jgi:predicted alpha/beta hydrolase
MDETAALDAYLFYRHERPFAEPEGRAHAVRAADGYPLAVSVYEPRRAPLGTVVIASATAVRRGYYAPFASWLASRGRRVVTFDYRGIGGSRPDDIAHFEASMLDWGERDLQAVLDFASEGFANVDVVTHSVGGQMLGLVPDPSAIRRVVMVGSQSGDYRLWPTASDRMRYRALWYALVPSIAGTLGYLPGALGIGEDLPGSIAREWAQWCRTPGYMVGGPNGEKRREAYRRLAVPVLAFGFEDDDYAPPNAVDALLALYESASIRRRHVARSEARVGHFGFFRERCRSTFWSEVATFFEACAPVLS